MGSTTLSTSAPKAEQLSFAAMAAPAVRTSHQLSPRDLRALARRAQAEVLVQRFAKYFAVRDNRLEIDRDGLKAHLRRRLPSLMADTLNAFVRDIDRIGHDIVAVLAERSRSS